MLKLVQYVSRNSCNVVQPMCSWRNLLISPNSVEKCITQRRHFLFCLTNRTTSSSSFALYCGEQPQQFQKGRSSKESTASTRISLSCSHQAQRAFHLSSTRLETSKVLDEALAARKQTSTSNNSGKSLFIDPDDHTEEIKIEGIM